MLLSLMSSISLLFFCNFFWGKVFLVLGLLWLFCYALKKITCCLIIFWFYLSPNPLLDTQIMYFMCVLPYANHHFTVMLPGREKRAGNGASLLCPLGGSVKLRPWAITWTALQLCCQHMNAWACTLLIQTLTQTFRLNIPAWPQGFSSLWAWSVAWTFS